MSNFTGFLYFVPNILFEIAVSKLIIWKIWQYCIAGAFNKDANLNDCWKHLSDFCHAFKLIIVVTKACFRSPTDVFNKNTTDCHKMTTTTFRSFHTRPLPSNIFYISHINFDSQFLIGLDTNLVPQNQLFWLTVFWKTNQNKKGLQRKTWVFHKEGKVCENPTLPIQRNQVKRWCKLFWFQNRYYSWWSST